MLTRSAKRKLQGEEKSQIETKYRRGSKLEFRLELGVELEQSYPEISAQLIFLPINEICQRYPLVGEIIFGYLDDQSLKQSRKVCTTWSTFLDSKPFYWTRMMKNYIGGQGEFSDEWKRVFNKIPLEIAKPFALYIPKLCRVCPEYFEVTMSPLQVAITNGRSHFFDYIYEKVIEKNPRDVGGRVLLHRAVNQNNLRICKFLHEKGNPLDPRSHNGNTPLHYAARKGFFQVFKYLFELVVEKNPQDNWGTMPIHNAARKGRFEIFKFIYEKTEEKNLQDHSGRMPIHHAAGTGQLEICKFIHQNGNNLNPLSNDGTTPLTIAASNGHFEVSRFIFGVVKQNLTVAQKAEVITSIKSKMNEATFSKLIMLILE